MATNSCLAASMAIICRKSLRGFNGRPGAISAPHGSRSSGTVGGCKQHATQVSIHKAATATVPVVPQYRHGDGNGLETAARRTQERSASALGFPPPTLSHRSNFETQGDARAFRRLNLRPGSSCHGADGQDAPRRLGCRAPNRPAAPAPEQIKREAGFASKNSSIAREPISAAAHRARPQ